MCTLVYEHSQMNLFAVPVTIWNTVKRARRAMIGDNDGIRYVEICHQTNKPRRAAE